MSILSRICESSFRPFRSASAALDCARASRVPRVFCVACGLLLSGCFPGIVYLSNRDLLDRIAGDMHFDVDASEFELFHVQVREDAVLFFYRGVRYAGDKAWIWRFSRKSTEQDPDSLADLGEVLPAIQAERRKFVPSTPVEESVDGAVVRSMTYTFEPLIRSDSGEAHQGRGIVATIERTEGGQPVVYYINLDNWGDRKTLDRPALDVFLTAIIAAR